MLKVLSYAPIQARLNLFREAEKVGVKRACLRLGVSRKTFYKWRSRYLSSGKAIESLQDQSRRPKRCPRQMDASIARRIREIRKHRECGPRLISYYLAKEKVFISPSGVYKALKRAGEVRPYRSRKRFKKRYTSLWIKAPGQKVQVDVKYCPKIPGHYQSYQYTAIDCFSRLRLCYVYPEVSPRASVDFLKRLSRFFPFKVACIQTDHGSEFTYAMFPEVKVIHPFDLDCKKAGIRHKLIPVATPHHNGQVENSHGKDKVECYGRNRIQVPQDYQALIQKRNLFWNCERPHQALGLHTPLEYLRQQPRYGKAALGFKAAYQLPPLDPARKGLHENSGRWRGIYGWKLEQLEREKNVTYVCG